MSLIEPSILDFARQYKRWLIYGALGAVLLALVLFLYQCGSDYVFKSKVQKQKDEISNQTKEIANVTNQIVELEKKKEGLQVNVNAATEQLQKDIFGREDAKRETNQALANFQKAVDQNTNIDRTIEDMNRVLEKLEQ